MRVPTSEASSFGIMTVDSTGRIVEFEEKPAVPTPMPGDDKYALASTGIYIFNQDVLTSELDRDHADNASSHDFGNDLLPRLIKSHRVYGYQFGSKDGRVTPDRYWRDVGTIDSYFDANMDLLSPEPPLDLYQDSWPIRTYHGQHPPARVITATDSTEANIRNSILGSGSMVLDASIMKSILSAKVRVEKNAYVESSILFDNVRVGAGAKLRRCIVDKHVKIPDGMTIGYNREKDEKRFKISDNGVLVVSKEFSES